MTGHSEKLNDRLSKDLDLISQKTGEGLYKDSVISVETECPDQCPELDESESSHLPPDLDPAMVNKYFKVLFAAILIMSIDLGILPASTIKM